MLDPQSLEIISQFKQSLFQRRTAAQPPALVVSNRGNKLASSGLGGPADGHLRTKLVEYDNTSQVVYTNDELERSNRRSKRKWNAEHGVPDDDIESETSDSDPSSDDDHPLKKIRLSEILAPLTHPSELVTHSAILNTYKLPVFSNLANNLIHLIEVEQNNLNWLNKLLQVLNGEDWYYVLEDKMGLEKYDHGLNDDGKSTETADGTGEAGPETGPGTGAGTGDDDPHKRITRSAGLLEVSDPFFALPETFKRYEAFQTRQTENQDDPVREELINYLQVSIQRQHEYIKNLTQLRNGLVRADRLKQDLFKWAKEMHDKKST